MRWIRRSVGRARRAVGATLATVILAAPASFANSNGVEGLARPESGSCGTCHGPSELSGGAYPAVYVDVFGLPEAYAPGVTYELTVVVFGPILPLAGFDLEVTGGRLEARNAPVPEGGTPSIRRAGLEATHTATALVPVWSVGWRAPACGFGPVSVYLAGNSVNGDQSNDQADLWAVLPAPRVVPAASCP